MHREKRLLWIMGLGLALVLGAAQSARAWAPKKARLMTRWAAQVSPENALPEYPRPQMVRSAWKNLNGLWDMAVTPADAGLPRAWTGQILVPFPVESALSGVMRPMDQTLKVWYRRNLQVPAGWAGKRVFLRFGAVDWDATVWLNGKRLGEHRGGYDAFSFDITDALDHGAGVLVVSVWNPGDSALYPHGKQSFHPGGIFYTACTGIWQTVWMEPVPKGGIEGLRMTPDLGSRSLRLNVAAGSGTTVRAVALAGGKPVAEASGPAGKALELSIRHPRLWSPQDPFLYDLRVSLSRGGQPLDAVTSYFGMRSVSVGHDAKGVTRPFLNGKPMFEAGVLDQGYWPDGIYTAPTDDALKYDIETVKKFNLSVDRKHMKVEPQRWYYWCDKLGLLVLQDMPSGRFDRGDALNGVEKSEFKKEFKAMIAGLYDHPCVVQWTVFNEGWYQFDTERLTAWVRSQDPSRLVDDASGWVDKGVGDMADMHRYPGPGCPAPEEGRFDALGEFGGLSLPIPDHSYQGGGYENLATQSDYDRRFMQLWRDVWRLKDAAGLSMAIYTQLTDVETECNGLMSYDRAVLRPTLKPAADAVKGVSDLPAEATVVPDSRETAQMWRYTTRLPQGDWQAPGYDDSSWALGSAGFGTDGTPGAVVRTRWDGSDIWIRRHFTLKSVPLLRPRFSLYHDEDVQLYLNGVPAAQAGGFVSSYMELGIAPAAAKALRKGENTLAAHCLNTVGGQDVDAGIVEDTTGGKR